MRTALLTLALGAITLPWAVAHTGPAMKSTTKAAHGTAIGTSRTRSGSASRMMGGSRTTTGSANRMVSTMHKAKTGAKSHMTKPSSAHPKK